jgi:hypothetical protein
LKRFADFRREDCVYATGEIVTEDKKLNAAEKVFHLDEN